MKAKIREAIDDATCLVLTDQIVSNAADAVLAELASLLLAAKKLAEAVDAVVRTDWTHVYGEDLDDPLEPGRGEGKTDADVTGYRQHLNRGTVKDLRSALLAWKEASK